MKGKRSKKRVEEAVRRRVRGGRLLLSGKSPREVAAATGVSRQTAYSWKAIVERDGLEALRKLNRGGRPASLSDEDKEGLVQALLEGPTAHGFATELWTIARVRRLLKERFGVSFSAVHVWRLLGQVGFSSKKPASRALERNEAQIEHWKKRRWPALKKKPSARLA
jgi:transposase